MRTITEICAYVRTLSIVGHYYIAGGAIRNGYHGIKINDIDLFFIKRIEFENTCTRLGVSIQIEGNIHWANATIRGQEIQLIYTNGARTIWDIVNAFDVTVNTAWYDMVTNEMYIPEDLKKKVLVAMRPIDMNIAARIRRFESYGFKQRSE